MEIVADIQDQVVCCGPSVVAIGVFDGVHMGHQRVLALTVAAARARGVKSGVLTFDRHPIELFAPGRAPRYLSSLDERLRLIGELGGGIDVTAVARFDIGFAAYSPEEFVHKILVERMECREAIVGADFRFGKDRAGDVDFLRHAGASLGFTTTVIPPVLLSGERVSSTLIRNLLADGSFEEATAMLGHYFGFAGLVVPGKQLGREIGFPTANIEPLQVRHQIPSPGVYAAFAQTTDGERHKAAVSIGINPTTDRDGLEKIEAYLLDGFDRDIYGEVLSLEFVARLRGEIEFGALGALVDQIKTDVEDVDAILTAEQA